MKIQTFRGSVLLVMVFLAPSAVEALRIDLSFTGSTFLTDSDFIPPDTMGAVGPDHFVELINGRYSVYRKLDGTRVQTSTLNDFWRNAGAPPAGAFAFDPRVVYDSASQRWFAASTDNSFRPNNFLVAVSNSSNPTQGWKGFAIPSDRDRSHWADFPTLGVNRNGVYVAANMFPLPLAGSGVTTTVLVLSKADLIAGSIVNRTLFENLDPVSTGFSLQPAFGDKSGSGGPLATLLSDYNTAGGWFKRSDILGTVTSPVLDTTNKLVAVPPFTGPPNAPQPGPKEPLEVLDSRFSANVVMRNGELWGVQGVNADGRAALRWFSLDAETNTLSQSGLITDPKLSFYYGSITLNDFGNVLIGFSGSGASQFVSAYAVEGRTAGGVTTFGEPVLLKAGLSDYQVTFGSGRNRWGDYSATTLDPTNPFRFWTIQEWVSETDIWSTRISAIDVAPVPEPATLVLFGTAAAGLGLARWRQRRRTQQP